MAKELDKTGREYIDGKPVEHYDGKFAKGFPMFDAEATGISSGDTVTFFVTATVGVPSFSYPKKSNGIKRTNVFNVTEAIMVDEDNAAFLLDQLDRKVEE